MNLIKYSYQRMRRTIHEYITACKGQIYDIKNNIKYENIEQTKSVIIKPAWL